MNFISKNFKKVFVIPGNHISFILLIFINNYCFKKDTAKNLLEIRIFYGGSIKLWDYFFINVTLYELDIININNVWDRIDILKSHVLEDMKQFIKTYDLIPNKRRYDDIIFTINLQLN